MKAAAAPRKSAVRKQNAMLLNCLATECEQTFLGGFMAVAHLRYHPVGVQPKPLNLLKVSLVD